MKFKIKFLSPVVLVSVINIQLGKVCCCTVKSTHQLEDEDEEEKNEEKEDEEENTFEDVTMP